MITRDCPTPTVSATAASPTAVASGGAPLALARVFLWETAEHAPFLAHYLLRAGHPFISRSPDSLPDVVRARSRRGRVFELFTLPLDLSAIVDSLRRAEIQRELEVILDLADLPLLMVVRKKRPADPLHPERELRGILDLLPTWRPNGLAGTVLPLPTTAAPTRSRTRKPPLQAPFAPRTDDDDDALALFGSQT